MNSITNATLSRRSLTREGEKHYTKSISLLLLLVPPANGARGREHLAPLGASGLQDLASIRGGDARAEAALARALTSRPVKRATDRFSTSHDDQRPALAALSRASKGHRRGRRDGHPAHGAAGGERLRRRELRGRPKRGGDGGHGKRRHDFGSTRPRTRPRVPHERRSRTKRVSFPRARPVPPPSVPPCRCPSPLLLPRFPPSPFIKAASAVQAACLLQEEIWCIRLGMAAGFNGIAGRNGRPPNKTKK